MKERVGWGKTKRGVRDKLKLRRGQKREGREPREMDEEES